MDAIDQEFEIKLSHYLLATGPHPYLVKVVDTKAKKELFTFWRSSLESATQLFTDLEKIFYTIRAIVQYPQEP